MKHFYGNFAYYPVDPVPDNDRLAQHMRLMLLHDMKTGPYLFIAKRGELTAGWVVGVGVN